MAEARSVTAFSRRSLFQAARSAARRFGADRQIVEDAVSGTLTYRQLLMAARIFAGRFARMTAPGEGGRRAAAQFQQHRDLSCSG